MEVSENRDTLFGGPFKGILFYLGEIQGCPYFGRFPYGRLGRWVGGSLSVVRQKAPLLP